MSRHEKCVIVGSGPAGYTAAIYAARANMNPVLFTGREPGGQLMITTDVENFPGYPNGIMGPEMMEDLKNQALRFETEVNIGVMIEKVDFSKRPHVLWTDAGEEIHADSVIIATGASARWLGIESETTFANRGVSACAVCDGFFYRGQEVSIVGGGDSACEEATYLSKLCPKVHMFVRRDEFRASKIMQERILNNEKIEVHWHTEVDEILGDDNGVTSVRVFNNQTNEKTTLPVSAVFVAIGHIPNTSIFADFLNMDDTGYILTNGKTTHTNVDGVFACGDAQDKDYRQAITAAGTGCMAALDAERYLTSAGII